MEYGYDSDVLRYIDGECCDCKTYSCGETFATWRKCGKDFRSKLVSAAKPKALVNTIDEVNEELASIYNSGDITAEAIASVGVFVGTTSVVVHDGTAVSWFGVKETTQGVAAMFSAFKLANPTSVLRTKYRYRILSNDEVQINLRFILGSSTSLRTLIISCTIRAHIIKCGCRPYQIDSAIVTSETLLK